MWMWLNVCRWKCQKWQSCCYQVCFFQAQNTPKLVFGPRCGSLRRYPRPPSRLGRWTPPPHTVPPRRLRRLDSRRLRLLGCQAPKDNFLATPMHLGHVRLSATINNLIISATISWLTHNPQSAADVVFLRFRCRVVACTRLQVFNSWPTFSPYLYNRV